jgi:hypothetical protein
MDAILDFDGDNLVVGDLRIPVRPEALEGMRARRHPPVPVTVIETRNPHYPGGLDVLAPAGSWGDNTAFGWANQAFAWAGRATRGRDAMTDAACLTLSADEVREYRS